ncbi:MAG: DUF2065 domain-containing protein [Methylophilaceae bacterium]|nr:DUF2065 domain-containing protein [Methylophilaceae bacterium]
MKSTLLSAFGLLLVLEGILPLVAPKAWRQTFQRMLEMTDGQLRFVGLASMFAGSLLLLILG